MLDALLGFMIANPATSHALTALPETAGVAAAMIGLRAPRPEATAALSRALGGAPDPAARLWQIAEELDAPRSLAELGMQEEDIERIAEEVTSRSYGNPRPVTYEDARALLRAAWAGEAPSAHPGA